MYTAVSQWQANILLKIVASALRFVHGFGSADRAKYLNSLQYVAEKERESDILGTFSHRYDFFWIILYCLREHSFRGFNAIRNYIQLIWNGISHFCTDLFFSTLEKFKFTGILIFNMLCNPQIIWLRRGKNKVDCHTR